MNDNGKAFELRKYFYGPYYGDTHFTRNDEYDFVRALYEISDYQFTSKWGLVHKDKFTIDVRFTNIFGRDYFEIDITAPFEDTTQNNFHLFMRYHIGSDTFYPRRYNFEHIKWAFNAPFKFVNLMSLLEFETRESELFLKYTYARIVVKLRNKSLKKRMRSVTDRAKKTADRIESRLYEIRNELRPFKEAMSKVSKLRNGIDIVGYNKRTKDHEYLKALRAIKLVKKFDKINQELEDEINQILEL